MTIALQCRDLRLTYGPNEVLHGVDLTVAEGESVVLLGPSGSGKSSLLYAVAGFVAPSGGEIRIGERTVSTPRVQEPPERRGVAMVFQHYALWPHLSALDTVAYPLRRAGQDRAAARRRAAELLALMGVAALADRRPSELSGGEQQRIGVARALARDARLLLLDEPTAHLDAPLRAALVAEMAEQQRRSNATALWATHDVTEALAVADRVGVLRDGRLVQLGTPSELYERPVDLWTARLSGPASVLRLNVVERHGTHALIAIDGRRATLLLDSDAAPGSGPTHVLVRPDWASLGGGLEASVLATWYRGPHTDYRLSTAAGDLEVRHMGPPQAAVGDSVTWRLSRGWALARGDGEAPLKPV